MRILLLWCAVVVLGALPVAGGDLPPDVMPLDEVRLGMQGVARITIQGEHPQEFPFEVIGIDRWVTVRMLDPSPVLHDFPDGNMIVEGMSGSPFSIDGRLLGGVRHVRQFSRESIAWVQPLEHILGHLPDDDWTDRTVPNPTPPTELEPGMPFESCTFWGAIRSCYNATVTYRDAQGRWFLQGHGLDEDDDETERGAVALPLWRARVDVTSTSWDTGHMDAVGMEPMIGTIVWNGEDGAIAVTDRLPRVIPVTVTLNGFVVEPVHAPFSTYDGNYANNRIVKALDQIVKHYLSNGRCAWADTEITVQGMDEPIRLRDALFNFVRPDGHSGLEQTLTWLFRYVRPKPVVERITVTLTATDACDILQPTAAKQQIGPDGHPGVQIILRRERDYRSMTAQFPVVLPEQGTYESAALYDGVVLRRFAMSHLPFPVALKLLSGHPDGTGLYVIVLGPLTVIQPTEGDGVPEHWGTMTRPVLFLERLDTSGYPVIASPDNVVVVHPMSAPEE